MLETDTQAHVTGVRSASVIQRGNQPPRPVIGDTHVDVDQAFILTGAQQHIGLLDRMFGVDLQIARYVVGVGRLALFH